MRHFSTVLFCLCLTGCAALPLTPRAATLPPTSLPSTLPEAQQVLIDFLAALSARQYAEADRLYGGAYEQLLVFSPEADPAAHASLWADACERAGLRCLPVRSAIFLRLEAATHVFQVEFSNPDGSLFVLGPCCGSNETEMPPVSQFEYHVTQTASGRFVVTDLPPYVP